MWWVFAAVCNFIVLGIVGIAAIIGISQKVNKPEQTTVLPITYTALPSATPTLDENYNYAYPEDTGPWATTTPSCTPTSTELPCEMKVPKEDWHRFCTTLEIPVKKKD
jgi:hypothetical protein